MLKGICVFIWVMDDPFAPYGSLTHSFRTNRTSRAQGISSRQLKPKEMFPPTLMSKYKT